MTTLQEALPCPFCGSSEGLDYRDGSTHRWGIASCVSCGASSGETRREYPDVGEWHYSAMKQWNTRSALAQQGEQPVAEIMLDPETMARYVQYTLPLTLLPIGTKLYTAAPAPVSQEQSLTKECNEQQIRSVDAVGGQESMEGAGNILGSDRDVLVASILALLALDADGSLVPHGIGGHARALLTKSAAMLAAAPAPVTLPGMSEMNRTIAYTAASKLRELGYEWSGSDWKAAAPAPQGGTK